MMDRRPCPVNLIGIIVFVIVLSACATPPDLADDGVTVDDADATSVDLSEIRLEIRQAAALVRQGRVDEPLDILIPLIIRLEEEGFDEIAPADVRNAYVQRAFAHANDADFAAAAESLERAIEIHRDGIEDDVDREMRLHATLSQFYGQSGEPVASIRSIEQAIALNETLPEPDTLFAAQLRRSMGLILLDMNNPDGAVEAMQAAIQELAGRDDPDARAFTAVTYLRITDTLRMIGRHEQARQSGREAIEVMEATDAPVAYKATAYYLTAIAEALSGFSSGRDTYIRAIELFQQSPEPNYEYLGVAAYNVGLDFLESQERDEALTYFRIAERAYRTQFQLLNDQNRFAAGSVRQNVLESIRSRLADAEGQVSALEAEVPSDDL